jgi:signal transduction histidine kinase
MSLRRSVRLPITLAVVMMALLAVLTVGWVLLAVFGALANSQFAGLNWTLFALGTSFIVLLLVGVVIYMVLSIKAINLNRRQSNFIDSVTHELKSPIASMKLYLQTLSRRQVSEDQQASFYRFMLDDVERLDHLINQMLDAGRVESERVDGEAEDVLLAASLQQCAELIAMRYRVPVETITLDLQPCAVRARRTDLEMLFRNLLDNAVKYAGTPPAVSVTLRWESGRWAVARIADNGRGIPATMRRKIFGRFVRLGSELEREKPGTGLGLYIAQTIVRRLRGRIRVRDRRPEPGTVFEVHLPGVPQPPPAGPPREEPVETEEANA